MLVALLDCMRKTFLQMLKPIRKVAPVIRKNGNVRKLANLNKRDGDRNPASAVPAEGFKDLLFFGLSPTMQRRGFDIKRIWIRTPRFRRNAVSKVHVVPISRSFQV